MRTAAQKTGTSLSTALSRVALLAGAGASLPLTGNADPIHYSGPQNITDSSALGTGDVSYTVDLANDAMSGFTFTASFSSTNKTVYVTPVAATSFYVADSPTDNSNPTALPAGASVSLNSTFARGSGTLEESGAYQVGHWPADGTPAFLGVEFTDDDPAVGKSANHEYCGWVEIGASTSGGSAGFVIDGWAYDQGGCSIAAGQTSSATPEPDSLTLFALGAAGVMAFRARRRSRT